MSAFLWHDQCEAARGIKERFGSEKALGCLLGEKLLNFLRVQGNVSGPVYSVVDCIRSRARGIPRGPTTGAAPHEAAEASLLEFWPRSSWHRSAV